MEKKEFQKRLSKLELQKKLTKDDKQKKVIDNTIKLLKKTYTMSMLEEGVKDEKYKRR